MGELISSSGVEQLYLVSMCNNTLFKIKLVKIKLEVLTVYANIMKTVKAVSLVGISKTFVYIFEAVCPFALNF